MDDVISGAYVFTGERSAHSYHLNKMANTLSVAEKRTQFQADEAGYMLTMGCSDHEIDLVRRRLESDDAARSQYLPTAENRCRDGLRTAVNRCRDRRQDRCRIPGAKGKLTWQRSLAVSAPICAHTIGVARDNEFMDRLESDPTGLSELSIQDYMERGGTEGVEMIMWLAMRGALGGTVKRVHRNYTAPFTTGYGLLVLET